MNDFYKDSENKPFRTERPDGKKRKKLSIRINRVFFAVLYVIAVIACVAPRPSYSDKEQRELSRFPQLSAESLFSGDFFDGINTWFADTFPMRDQLLTVNQWMNGLYGDKNEEIHGSIEQGEDIPDPSDAVSQSVSSAPEASSAPDYDDTVSGVKNNTTNTDDTPAQTLNALLIMGDTAYEYYNFVRDTADSYAAAVNRAAQNLKGTATVYDMVVPNSMDICAPESVRGGLNTSDQRKAIDYMYGSMSSDVRTVDVYDTLKKHSGEYIFFRTDHHWTALGAYYSYLQFMMAKGAEPTPLDSFKVHEYTGFTGSFYRETQKQAMAGNPDTIYAYEPASTNDIVCTLQNGGKQTYRIVQDVSTWKNESKYSTFIGADQPFGVITNPDKTDGSACIVIKESYGNAFVPFLTGNYQYVYVVDYRYFSKVDSRNLTQLVADTGAQDVLFLNNISATRNNGLVKAISSLVG
jgi:hypothetical protein